MTPDDIEPLLPELYVRMVPQSSVLRGLLASMAALLDPQEHAHERLLEWLDPRTAPPEMLPVLCQWVGLDPALCFDERALRRLILVAPQITARRGTRQSLELLLETCTGQTGFVLEESLEEPFVVLVRPPAALRGQAERIEAIVRAGKPAHVRHVLAWEGSG